MKLSHSKLNCLLNNPAEYYLSYVQGIRPKVEKSALSVGSAVHWGIEHDTDDLTEYFEIKTKDEYSRDQLLAEAMVSGYLRHKDELFKSLLTDPSTKENLTLIEEMHEVYITGKLKSYKESCGYHDFVGIIDLLLLTDKGFIIVDYKTSGQTPDWSSYIEQIYRYIFLLRCEFPDVPVIKIGIINLKKTQIRQKKTENWDQFLNRMKFEYELNDEEYVNYHEYSPEELDKTLLNNYINNLTTMADTAYSIASNNLFYINYTDAAYGKYGKSQYYDIFYHTPSAEYLYTIDDKIWDNESRSYIERRDCKEIDMKVMDEKVINKYNLYKELKLMSQKSFDDFENDLAKNYSVDTELLKLYRQTFEHEIS